MSSGSPCHRRRSVDSNDLMTKARQVTADPTFAAANVECQATGWRYEREKRISVKAPVTIVARCARPGDPVLGVGFPGIPQHDHIVPSGVSQCPTAQPRGHDADRGRVFLPLVMKKRVIGCPRPPVRGWRGSSPPVVSGAAADALLASCRRSARRVLAISRGISGRCRWQRNSEITHDGRRR